MATRHEVQTESGNRVKRVMELRATGATFQEIATHLPNRVTGKPIRAQGVHALYHHGLRQLKYAIEWGFPEATAMYEHTGTYDAEGILAAWERYAASRPTPAQYRKSRREQRLAT